MGRTALVYAIVSNKLSCVEILLKKGAEVSIAGKGRVANLENRLTKSRADNDGRTPVHWACFHQKSQLLQLLLSRGADALAKVGLSRLVGGLHLMLCWTLGS
jgi:ankyrin repeat protein